MIQPRMDDTMPQYYNCNNPMEHDHLDYAEANRENRRNLKAHCVPVPKVPDALADELAQMYGHEYSSCNNFDGGE